MPDVTEGDLFLADLQDDLFACYAVVADEGAKAWTVAKRAYKFVAQVNIYRFDDHAVLKQLVGDGRPVAVAFSRTGKVVATLGKAKAEDLDAVLGALEAALREAP